MYTPVPPSASLMPHLVVHCHGLHMPAHVIKAQCKGVDEVEGFRVGGPQRLGTCDAASPV